MEIREAVEAIATFHFSTILDSSSTMTAFSYFTPHVLHPSIIDDTHTLLITSFVIAHTLLTVVVGNTH